MTRPPTEAVVAGVRTPVLQAGPLEATEAVVFVHGNPGAGRDWTDLVERTAQFARAIAPDMPGFGAADKPPDFDYTIAGYAEHLARLLDQLAVKRAHLVLHDFGGPWGLRWAADHPEAFASATLINTGVLLDYRWHHWAKIWRTPILGELFQATTTKSAFRLLVGRRTPRSPASTSMRIYEQARDRGTQRAVFSFIAPHHLQCCPNLATRCDRSPVPPW